MKTPHCNLLAYCETTGGPICICSPSVAGKWRGSEQQDSLYWEVVNQIGTTTLFNYDSDYSFFNSETGNFAFFRGIDALILVEIISIEQEACIPWQGIEFEVDSSTRIALNMKDYTCFFDSSLSIEQDILPLESIYALDQSSTWNIAVLACNYDEACEVSFTSNQMNLSGIGFFKKAFWNTII